MLSRIVRGAYRTLRSLTEDKVYLRHVHIGRHTYGVTARTFYLPTGRECVTIGNFCSIATGVQFIFGDHPLDKVSTFPLRHLLRRETTNQDALYRGEIIVGNDVWLGRNALILSNVRIGDGAVVAAGAIVTRNVPPFAVVGGVPARVIKYRFSETQIQQLLSIAWWNWSDARILEHLDLFYEDVDAFIAQMSER